MMIASRNGFAVSGWKNPYPVMDSCIAWLDGEWNAGGGKHDTDNSRIVDLISGRQVDISGKNAVVGDNYINFPQDENADLAVFDTQVEFAKNHVCTVEAVWSAQNQSAPQIFITFNMGRLHLQYSQKAFFFPENNGIKTGFYRNYFGTHVKSSQVGVFRGDGIGSDAYRNSTLIEQGIYGSGYGWTIDYSDTSISLFSTKAGWMTLNSIRFHSRELTASEIAANYAVDKARFGLP